MLLCAAVLIPLLTCGGVSMEGDPLKHEIPDDWRRWRGDAQLTAAIETLPPDRALTLVRWLAFAREAQLSGHPMSAITVREALEVDPATLILRARPHPGVETHSPLDVALGEARWLP